MRILERTKEYANEGERDEAESHHRQCHDMSHRLEDPANHQTGNERSSKDRQIEDKQQTFEFVEDRLPPYLFITRRHTGILWGRHKSLASDCTLYPSCILSTNRPDAR